jgi:hypothetical protein
VCIKIQAIPYRGYPQRSTLRGVTSTNEDRTGDGTSRVSVQQAADILGISTEATRQRIKRGTITTERDENGNVFVLLNTDEANTRTNYDGTHTNDVGTYDGTALAPLLESQQDQIDYLRDVLKTRDRELAEMRRLLAGALERIPELQSPPDTHASTEPRESPQTASEEPSGTQAPPEEERRERSW